MIIINKLQNTVNPLDKSTFMLYNINIIVNIFVPICQEVIDVYIQKTR